MRQKKLKGKKGQNGPLYRTAGENALTFPCFIGRRQGNHQWKQSFFVLAEPLKNPWETRDNAEKQKQSCPFQGRCNGHALAGLPKNVQNSCSWAVLDIFQGHISHLRNLGPNSGKRILDARILDPNSWVKFFHPVFSSKRAPPPQNSKKIHLPKFNPEIGQKTFTLHLYRSIWLRHFLAFSRRFFSTFPLVFLSLRVLPEDYCKEDPCNLIKKGWGVGEELTKSWPTFEQLWVQNLAWAFSYCFSPTESAYKIRLARSWPRVGHGLPTFDTNISVLKLQGSFLQ